MRKPGAGTSSISDRGFRPHGLSRILTAVLAMLSQLLFITASAQQISDLPPGLIQYADYVFTNGYVHTADKDKDYTVAQAVAVRGNLVLAVGKNEDVLQYAGPKTRRIDLKGGSITPGYIYTNSDNVVPGADVVKASQWDGALHPPIGGKTIDDVLSTMAAIVSKHGKTGEPLFLDLQDQWSGVAAEAWTLDMIDEIAPDIPIVIYLDSSHSYANTAMLNLAIEKGFPADHLTIGRDKDGNFIGKTGGQFSGFVGREIRPWPSPEWFDNVAIPEAREMFANMARFGVTGSSDHMTGISMTVLNKMFHENNGRDLRVRNHIALDFPRQNFESEKYFKRIGNITDFTLNDERGPMLTVVGISLGPFSGAPDGASSLLTIEPKTNIIKELAPNPHGWNKWTGEWWNGLAWSELTTEQRNQTDYGNLMLARQHGYSSIGWHTMGSRAIKMVMEFVKEAEEQDNLYVKKLWRPYGTIHNIDWVPENYAYWQAHPEIHDLMHFSISVRAGVEQRDAKPIGLKNVLELMYGMDGLERMAPLNTLLEKGIPFHIEGTDPGKNSMDHPMWQIYKAVTRKDEEGRVIAAEEAIDRETALVAMTRWTARFVGALDQLGSIEPGKLADLVVYDADVMKVPIEEVPMLTPVMTMLGGWIAYENPAGGRLNAEQDLRGESRIIVEPE